MHEVIYIISFIAMIYCSLAAIDLMAVLTIVAALLGLFLVFQNLRMARKKSLDDFMKERNKRQTDAFLKENDKKRHGHEKN